MNRSFANYTTTNVSNHLLLKDDVGRPKPTTRDLPYEGFTYGKAETRDNEGAGEGKYILFVNVINSIN
jgi:hypothetical protein